MMLSTLTVASFMLAAGGAEVIDTEVAAALRLLADDPPIAALQEAAVDHFAVSHGDLSAYRAEIKLKALLPTVSGGYTYGDNKTDRTSTDFLAYPAPFLPPQVVDNTSGNNRGYNASATWSLGSLIFDSAQLETYSLVGIHEDIIKEVTTLYYTRQHNILTLALDPPKDPRARAALMLRTREIEALLDALTGGVWTKLKKGGRQ